MTDTLPSDNAPTLVLMRATITLPQLSVGEVVSVDPSVPYIADCIEAGFLVEVEA